jgi:hypothetical protein
MNTKLIKPAPEVPVKETEVTFNVKCELTAVGDRVALVGNIKMLGEWAPEKA